MITVEQKPMLRFLAVMTAASMVGLQGYTILFNNYAVEVIRLDGNGVGLIQSIREVPGLLALLFIINNIVAWVLNPLIGRPLSASASGASLPLNTAGWS
jgi:hypothetical protein